MKSDQQLRQDVLAELDWDPSVDARPIGVAVEQGVVTLTGQVDSLAASHAAESAVRRVRGVRSLALQLEVRPDAAQRRPDAEIAAAVQGALAGHAQLPPGSIRAQVHDGQVQLEGEVEWDFQRQAAADAVRALRGVVGLDDHIVIRPRPAPADLAARIRQALERHAERAARHIEVDTDGSTVTLRGTVDSWAACVAANGAATSAPGVTHVLNEIRVES